MDEKQSIKFNFKWEGKDFEKIAPNVIETAKKLVELNLIKVDENLDEEGYVLYTGTWSESGFSVGDKFKNETIKIYASYLNGSSNYTIIIADR